MKAGKRQPPHDPRSVGWPVNDKPRELLIDLPDLPDTGEPVSRRVAGVLGDAIRSRMFRQGQKMPSAASIAWRFGTSVDTGRCAIKLLVAEGLVRKGPGGAAYVRGPQGGPGGCDPGGAATPVAVGNR